MDVISIVILVGVAGALLVNRWIRGMLFEVSVLSPLAVGGVIVFLVGIAILAAGVPTRRALRIDPAAALRVE